MGFTKYSSIENAYREKYVNFMIVNGFTHEAVKYQVTEKVHGSNFQLWTDGVQVKAGKRSSFLGSNELTGFFNAETVYNRYRENVLRLFVNRLGKDYKAIAVYGELFGGVYPHDDVERVAGASQVQKGIYYNSDNDFLVFDIRVTLDNGNTTFLNQNLVVELVEEFGLLHTPVIATDITFTEAMAIANDSESTVYDMFGLPKIDDNIIEGTVIKPVEPIFFNSGERVLLKNKNSKWSEKAKKTKVPKAEIKFDGIQREVYDDLSSRVTENRLRNIISKFGRVGQKDFGKLLQLMTQDIIEEHTKEADVKLPHIEEKKDRKIITKMLNGEIAALIRPNFVNIIDNNF